MSPVIRKDCPCPKVTCPRHTLCDECEAAQAQKAELPFCRRPKHSFWQNVRKRFGIGTGRLKAP